MKNKISVDEYIDGFPESTRIILKKIRKCILDLAPDAEELISYQMPAYKLNGILVYFAAYEKHIGFYPTPSAIIAFQKELSTYKSSKGAVQFPFSKEIPFDLICKMVEFKIQENRCKKQGWI